MNIPGVSISTGQSIQLQEYVESVHVYQFDTPQRIHLNPEGHFELVVQSGSFRQASESGTNALLRPDVFIGGLHNKSYQIEALESNSLLISICFKADAARLFIPDKLGLFQNTVIAVENVFETHGKQLNDQINNANSISNRVDLLEQFLVDQFKSKPKSPVSIALDLIRKTEGCVDVKTLAGKTGLSLSRFRDRFKEEVGLSPKVYTRVVRIHSIAQKLRQSNSLSLTELTYQYGYFDQAHFIHDFKKVMGKSPLKYMKEQAFFTII